MDDPDRPKPQAKDVVEEGAPTPSPAVEREARLVAALRANLRRRKTGPKPA